MDTFSLASGEPRGIVFQNVTGDIVASDFNSSVLYIHRGLTKETIRAISAPEASGTAAIDIVQATGDMLSSNATSGTIYRLTNPQSLSYAAIRYITQEV